MSSPDEIKAEYASSLADLTFNSKPLINVLTMLADENSPNAKVIVEAIEEHLSKVQTDVKLPILYLIDCIVKNVGGTYTSLFSQNIVSTFCGVFKLVDEKTRAEMYKLRQTWNDVFPQMKLYAIDVQISGLDPAWPVTAKPPTNSIYFNPKFLKTTKENGLNGTNGSDDENDKIGQSDDDIEMLGIEGNESSETEEPEGDTQASLTEEVKKPEPKNITSFKYIPGISYPAIENDSDDDDTDESESEGTSNTVLQFPMEQDVTIETEAESSNTSNKLLLKEENGKSGTEESDEDNEFKILLTDSDSSSQALTDSDEESAIQFQKVISNKQPDQNQIVKTSQTNSEIEFVNSPLEIIKIEDSDEENEIKSENDDKSEIKSENESDITETEPLSRGSKRKLKDESSIVAKKRKNDHSVFGEHVAASLSNLSKLSAIHVKYMINNILFRAELKEFNSQSAVANNNPISSSVADVEMEQGDIDNQLASSTVSSVKSDEGSEERYSPLPPLGFESFKPIRKVKGGSNKHPGLSNEGRKASNPSSSYEYRPSTSSYTPSSELLNSPPKDQSSNKRSVSCKSGNDQLDRPTSPYQPSNSSVSYTLESQRRNYLQSVGKSLPSTSSKPSISKAQDVTRELDSPFQAYHKRLEKCLSSISSKAQDVAKELSLNSNTSSSQKLTQTLSTLAPFVSNTLISSLSRSSSNRIPENQNETPLNQNGEPISQTTRVYKPTPAAQKEPTSEAQTTWVYKPTPAAQKEPPSEAQTTWVYKPTPAAQKETPAEAKTTWVYKPTAAQKEPPSEAKTTWVYKPTPAAEKEPPSKAQTTWVYKPTPAAQKETPAEAQTSTVQVTSAPDASGSLSKDRNGQENSVNSPSMTNEQIDEIEAEIDLKIKLIEEQLQRRRWGEISGKYQAYLRDNKPVSAESTSEDLPDSVKARQNVAMSSKSVASANKDETVLKKPASTESSQTNGAGPNFLLGQFQNGKPVSIKLPPNFVKFLSTLDKPRQLVVLQKFYKVLAQRGVHGPITPYTPESLNNSASSVPYCPTPLPAYLGSAAVDTNPVPPLTNSSASSSLSIDTEALPLEATNSPAGSSSAYSPVVFSPGTSMLDSPTSSMADSTASTIADLVSPMADLVSPMADTP